MNGLVLLVIAGAFLTSLLGDGGNHEQDRDYYTRVELINELKKLNENNRR